MIRIVYPHRIRPQSVLLAALFSVGCASDKDADTGPEDTSPQFTADVQIILDGSDPGEAFGNLFRAVNLDAGKQMHTAEYYDRIQRLMCPDPTNCTPGAVRLWDKVEYGRFALEEPVSNAEVLEELHKRSFSVLWTIRGTPAFLNPDCTGCLLNTNSGEFHLLRALEMSAEDEKNPTGQAIQCTCSTDDWWYTPPTTDTVGGLNWLDYMETTVNAGLSLLDGEDARLDIGIWNEPDTAHWSGTQTQFVSMWCATAERLQQSLADRGDVAIGGPDVSSWANPIRPAQLPLLEEIQQTCGEAKTFDFLTYHNYSEPGRFLLESSVDAVRSWANNPDLTIDVGEYASSLGYGAESVSLCDPTAIASSPEQHPEPTGPDPTSILCDHRGATEDVAMAASMAGQAHRRLYRFEVWDWGTEDMLNSRMGLLTLHHLPKPAATAFWMMSHLQGPKIAVENQLGGAYPLHLLASHEGDHIQVVIAAQNRTVSDQFVRGLLSQGLVYSEDVAPIVNDCPLFQSEDAETLLSELASSELEAADILAQCPDFDGELATSLATALNFAAPRVGKVGDSFDLEIDLPGANGFATRHRLDAYHNTFAEAHRLWPNGEFQSEGFDFANAEDILWDYMTTPLDEMEVKNESLVVDIPPDSVTLLRVPLQ